MQQGVKFTEVLTWMTLENFEPSALWLDFENSAKGGIPSVPTACRVKFTQETTWLTPK